MFTTAPVTLQCITPVQVLSPAPSAPLLALPAPAPVLLLPGWTPRPTAVVTIQAEADRFLADLRVLLDGLPSPLMIHPAPGEVWIGTPTQALIAVREFSWIGVVVSDYVPKARRLPAWSWVYRFRSRDLVPVVRPLVDAHNDSRHPDASAAHSC